MGKFEDVAAQRTSRGLIADLWFFLRFSKKWWMAPVIVVLLMFGVLMLLGGTAAAPFIYTLF